MAEDEKFFDQKGGRLGSSVDQVRVLHSDHCTAKHRYEKLVQERCTSLFSKERRPWSSILPLLFLKISLFPTLFSPHRISQDGKGNIWAVEPKMQVEVSKEGDGMQKVREQHTSQE